MTTEHSTYIYDSGAEETVTLSRGPATPHGHALLKIEYSDGEVADCYVNTAWLRDRLDDLDPRPLTPDAITDEMVERARNAPSFDGRLSPTPRLVREILTAALTEPPARPEGAERWEDFLIDSLDYQTLTDQQIADLADRIAEEMNR